jgi:hypothetical protein
MRCCLRFRCRGGIGLKVVPVGVGYTRLVVCWFWFLVLFSAVQMVGYSFPFFRANHRIGQRWKLFLGSGANSQGT